MNRVLADSVLKVQQYMLFCDSFALQNLGHCLTHLFVTNHDRTCLAAIKICSSLHQQLQIHALLQLIKNIGFAKKAFDCDSKEIEVLKGLVSGLCSVYRQTLKLRLTLVNTSCT